MSSEVEWRRKWKPTLNAFPWQPIKVDGTFYLIKYKFATDSYEILLTDLVHFWHEELSDTALLKRVKVSSLRKYLGLTCSRRLLLGACILVEFSNEMIDRWTCQVHFLLLCHLNN